MSGLMIIALVGNVLRIASGLPGGNYFKVAKFIEYIIENPDTTYPDRDFIELLRSSIDSVVIDTQGGSYRIMELLIDTTKDFHIGIAQSDIVYSKVYFEHPDKQLEIYAIAVLFDEAMHLIMPSSVAPQKGLDLRSITTVITLDTNSGCFYTINRIFPALGKTPKYK